jgi:hypothetical protein
MSPEDLAYFRERASIERELAKSAPDNLFATLHLELAARYEALVAKEELKPKLRLIINEAWTG